MIIVRLIIRIRWSKLWTHRSTNRCSYRSTNWCSYSIHILTIYCLLSRKISWFLYRYRYLLWNLSIWNSSFRFLYKWNIIIRWSSMLMEFMRMIIYKFINSFNWNMFYSFFKSINYQNKPRNRLIINSVLNFLIILINPFIRYIICDLNWLIISIFLLIY